jgi:PAS domain S-box-containing protein
MSIRDRNAPPALLGRSAVAGFTALIVLGIATTGFLERGLHDRLVFLGFAILLLGVLAALLPILLRAARALESQNDRLREAEAKYRNLVDQIPAIVYLAEFGPDGEWIYVSAEIEPMLGYTPQEWIAHPHPFASHVHPEDKPEVLEAEERSHEQGDVFHAEYRMYTRRGDRIWIRDDAFPVRDEEGRPLFMQGIMYDVTDQKMAQEELSRALTTEREATDRLRALDEMKNTFLQAVSHELRTPLTQVLGIALTLQHKDLNLSDQQEDDFLAGLVKAARKLDGLLSDLLDVDRLGRGILEPKRRPTDVGALARQLVESSDILEDRMVKVDAPSVVVEVDPPKVERIVENLLSNAVRHTGPGTPVWISVARDPEGVLISVEDAGSGIPEELREAVFEPFRQGPDTPAHAPGMGVGLSLVARFAELHGGRAWVEERVGGGAAFRVLLKDEQARSTAAAPALPQRQAAFSSQRPAEEAHPASAPAEARAAVAETD